MYHRKYYLFFWLFDGNDISMVCIFMPRVQSYTIILCRHHIFIHDIIIFSFSIYFCIFFYYTSTQIYKIKNKVILKYHISNILYCKGCKTYVADLKREILYSFLSIHIYLYNTDFHRYNLVFDNMKWNHMELSSALSMFQWSFPIAVCTIIVTQ